jgi:hypothetical protein
MADLRRAAEELSRELGVNGSGQRRSPHAAPVREPKERALLRVAFAVEARCARCIERAVRKAAAAGADRPDVASAVKAVVRSGDGALLVFAAEALTAFDALTPAAAPARPARSQRDRTPTAPAAQGRTPDAARHAAA